MLVLSTLVGLVALNLVILGHGQSKLKKRMRVLESQLEEQLFNFGVSIKDHKDYNDYRFEKLVAATSKALQGPKKPAQSKTKRPPKTNSQGKRNDRRAKTKNN